MRFLLSCCLILSLAFAVAQPGSFRYTTAADNDAIAHGLKGSVKLVQSFMYGDNKPKVAIKDDNKVLGRDSRKGYDQKGMLIYSWEENGGDEPQMIFGYTDDNRLSVEADAKVDGGYKSASFYAFKPDGSYDSLTYKKEKRLRNITYLLIPAACR